MNRCFVDGWDERLGGVFLVLGVHGDLATHVEHTPALVRVDHQYGGYACLQESVTGLVLPLTVPGVPSKRALGPLFSALDAIAEGTIPHDGALPDPRVEAFGFTHGDAIDVDELFLIFSDYLELPRFESGAEAFVSAPLDDATRFMGWTVWQPDGALRFDDELADQLIAAGAISGRPLRCFLLWDNSD